MRAAPLALVLLLLAAPASAQSSRAWRISTAAAITAHGLDLGSSMYCLGAKTCHEANRAMAWAEDKPLAFSAVKMGTAAGLSWLSWKLHQKHRKAAIWFNVAQTVAFGAIAVRNSRQRSGGNP